MPMSKWFLRRPLRAVAQALRAAAAPWRQLLWTLKANVFKLPRAAMAAPAAPLGTRALHPQQRKCKFEHKRLRRPQLLRAVAALRAAAMHRPQRRRQR